jgi:hypothetical protein
LPASTRSLIFLFLPVVTRNTSISLLLWRCQL